MSWIQTFTGKKVFPFAMTPDQVCIEDIAHALALKCRFTGHCKRFYSIAEHSVRVSWLVRPEVQLAALLHDAAEAYLPDFARPLKGKAYFKLNKEPQASAVDKHYFRSESTDDGEHTFKVNLHNTDRFAFVCTGVYSAKSVEASILGVIWSALSVGSFSSASIMFADDILLATEARDLMGPPPEPWALDVPVLPETIEPWTAEKAEQEFLRVYRGLTREKAAV